MKRDQASLIDHDDDLHRQRERLTEIYEPETNREAMLIEELAQAYQQLEAFEADYRLWMRHETDHALHTLQRQAADDFLKLQRHWPKAPAAVAPIIGQSLNGALWLVNLWQIIVARLAPQAIGPVPGMDHACQALLAMGFSDKIQNLSNDGWWWAVRFLAIQADQQEAIKAWLHKSGACDKAAETAQARHRLDDAPDPAAARRELYDEAMRQLEHWQEKLQQIKAAEPALQQAQLAQARCMGLKIPGLATCLNNAARLRGAIQKTIRFIEDRLARFQKEKAALHKQKPTEPKPEATTTREAIHHPDPAKTVIMHPPQATPYPLSPRNKRRVAKVLHELERMDQKAALLKA